MSRMIVQINLGCGNQTKFQQSTLCTIYCIPNKHIHRSKIRRSVVHYQHAHRQTRFCIRYLHLLRLMVLLQALLKITEKEQNLQETYTNFWSRITKWSKGFRFLKRDMELNMVNRDQITCTIRDCFLTLWIYH